MEKKVLHISELISTDIRSRANIVIIQSAIDGINKNIILDFSNVTFISRSFTDELYNLMCDHKNISVSHMNDFVQSMLDIVAQGRKSKRVFKSEAYEIKECDDITSLSQFLSTL